MIANEALGEDKNNNSIQNTKINNQSSHSYLFTSCIIYTIFIFLFLLWTLINLWTRWNEIIYPVPSNGFDLQNFKQLIYPSITICNISPGVPLTHSKCQNFQNKIECDYKEEIFSFKKNKLRAKPNEQYHCLTYNDNLETAFVATKTGIQDMLTISLHINIDKYPKNSTTNGVMVSLHSQKTPVGNDFNIIAAPGEVFLVRLKKTVKEYLNSTIIESFEGKMSSMGQYNFNSNWGKQDNTIVLSFTYQDLNVMIVKELSPYTLFNFFSETGGVLSLLLGSSILNLIIILLQWSWGVRFNDIQWLGIGIKKDDNEQKENNIQII